MRLDGNVQIMLVQKSRLHDKEGSGVDRVVGDFGIGPSAWG